MPAIKRSHRSGTDLPLDIRGVTRASPEISPNQSKSRWPEIRKEGLPSDARKLYVPLKLWALMVLSAGAYNARAIRTIAVAIKSSVAIAFEDILKQRRRNHWKCVSSAYQGLAPYWVRVFHARRHDSNVYRVLRLPHVFSATAAPCSRTVAESLAGAEKPICS